MNTIHTQEGSCEKKAIWKQGDLEKAVVEVQEHRKSVRTAAAHHCPLLCFWESRVVSKAWSFNCTH